MGSVQFASRALHGRGREPPVAKLVGSLRALGDAPASPDACGRERAGGSGALRMSPAPPTPPRVVASRFFAAAAPAAAPGELSDKEMERFSKRSRTSRRRSDDMMQNTA